MFGVRCRRAGPPEALSYRVRTRGENTPWSSLVVADVNVALDNVRRGAGVSRIGEPDGYRVRGDDRDLKKSITMLTQREGTLG